MIIVTQSESRKIRNAIEKNHTDAQLVAKKIPTGIEICETQLYHLAQKIHQTQVNDEVTPYLPKVEEVSRPASARRSFLIQRLVSVEVARLHRLLQKRQRPQQHSYERLMADAKKSDTTKKRRYHVSLSMALGPATITTGCTSKIFKSQPWRWIKRTFSMSMSWTGILSSIPPTAHRDKVMWRQPETFSDFQLDGRKINVEISEKAPRGGGGGKRKRGKRKGG